MRYGNDYTPRRTKDLVVNQNFDDISRSIGVLSSRLGDKLDKNAFKGFLESYFIDGTVSIGDPTTDGSWRIMISGTDLVVERREAGAWVEKGRFLA